MPALILYVAPHIEPGGHHRDKFDAFLDGALIHSGPQILRPAARKLIALGYDPETLLTMWAEGASGASFTPRTIAAWAGEMLVEEDRSGFRIRRWSEPPQKAPDTWQVGGQNAQLTPADRDAA